MDGQGGGVRKTTQSLTFSEPKIIIDVGPKIFAYKQEVKNPTDRVERPAG